MAYTAPAGCDLSPAQWNDILASQESTIRENIQQDLAYDAPYLNSIAGDTWDNSNSGENLRTLVANRVSPAWSRVRPEFQRASTMCQVRPSKDQIGQTEYTTYMETLAGESPDICVRQARHGVKNSLTSAYTAMQQGIKELMDYDVRAQYLDRSGLKYVVNSTVGKNNRLTGGRKQVGATFNTSFLPNSPMSYQALINLIQLSANVHGNQLFGSGVDKHALVIAGFEQVETFRNEALVTNAVLAQTGGGYADGNNAIKMLEWTSIQHRGARLAVDSQPLRFNDWAQTGLPDLIEPEVSIDADYGKDSVPNSEWVYALYEIGFIVFKNAFKRVVPSSYAGEGQWKFAPQFVMGELKWHNVVDNNCNIKGDTGFFWYEVTRALQAWQPHAVIPFAYKRCDLADGLTPCTDIAVSS